MSDILTTQLVAKDSVTTVKAGDTTSQDTLADYRMSGANQQSAPGSRTETNTREVNAPYPDLIIIDNEVPVVTPGRTNTFRDFLPPRGTPENPTVGLEAATREAGALSRHFDLIPGKVNANFIDQRALDNYLRTNNDISPNDRRLLTDVMSHFDSVQQSYRDERGRESSGISRNDISYFGQQEVNLEYQYAMLAYTRQHFDQMAGPDGKITSNSLRRYGHRRIAEGASRDEIEMLDNMDSRMAMNVLQPTGVRLTRTSVESFLKPQRIYNYGSAKK